MLYDMTNDKKQNIDISNLPESKELIKKYSIKLEEMKIVIRIRFKINQIKYDDLKSYKVLWVCFISMFTSTQFIIAQDFYVSDSNGSDNNSGTLEAPFKTINKNFNGKPGGTVYVMDGIYQNENYGNEILNNIIWTINTWLL